MSGSVPLRFQTALNLNQEWSVHILLATLIRQGAPEQYISIRLNGSEDIKYKFTYVYKSIRVTFKNCCVLQNKVKFHTKQMSDIPHTYICEIPILKGLHFT
jgi:hypothetical protein